MKRAPEQLQRAFAAACGLPFQQPDPPPAAASKPPVVVDSDPPKPATAGGAPLTREQVEAASRG